MGLLLLMSLLWTFSTRWVVLVNEVRAVMYKCLLALQCLLMTNVIDYYLERRAKWESDYATHD